MTPQVGERGGATTKEKKHLPQRTQSTQSKKSKTSIASHKRCALSFRPLREAQGKLREKSFSARSRSTRDDRHHIDGKFA
jgi:hypothetical protein